MGAMNCSEFPNKVLSEEANRIAENCIAAFRDESNPIIERAEKKELMDRLAAAIYRVLDVGDYGPFAVEMYRIADAIPEAREK